MVKNVCFILFAIVLMWVWMSSREESFSNDPSACSQSSWGPKACQSCTGNVEGECASVSPQQSIWNQHGVPSGVNRFAGGIADGRRRVFKNPAYYGMDPSRFSYGEPYYTRDDKY